MNFYAECIVNAGGPWVDNINNYTRSKNTFFNKISKR